MPEAIHPADFPVDSSSLLVNLIVSLSNIPSRGSNIYAADKITTSSFEVSPRTNDCFQPIKMAGCVKGARNNISGQEKACRLFWRHSNLLAENTKLLGGASGSLENRKIMLK